jgi:hypothetical protein
VLSEYKNFLDETDFWKISGFDHAWYRLHLNCQNMFIVQATLVLVMLVVMTMLLKMATIYSCN